MENKNILDWILSNGFKPLAGVWLNTKYDNNSQGNIKTYTSDELISMYEQELQNKISIKMKFKDAPVGARFKYPKCNKIWVKINSYPKGQFNDGDGLIVQWNGNIEGNQSHCSFVDENEGIDFDTVVELV